MIAKAVQEGKTVDYTPTVDVDPGDVVVQGELVGVAHAAIPANTKGAIHVEGVFDFAKAAGVGSGIAVGSNVYFDVAEAVAKTNAEAGANKLIGKSVLAATDADTTVRVRLSQ